MQNLPDDVAARVATTAATAPLANPETAYPSWYLKRWHFLRSGYLSDGSVRWYDRLVRPVYYVGSERTVIRWVAGVLRARAARDVLELGCGTGRALVAIGGVLPNSNMRGVDLSPYMLQAALKRAEKVAGLKGGATAESWATWPIGPSQLIHADAATAPFTEAGFDAVVAMHLLGHVPDEVAGAITENAKRTLRPNGALVVVDHPWHRVRPKGFQRVGGKSFRLGLVRATVYERA